MKKMKCSVLMCVYRGDKPEFFTQAIESILEQTVKTDDIVIVVDGPIGKKLEATIKKYDKLPVVNVKWLAKNIGVGLASNIGINLCRHDLIAKMDADDISVPDRFEKQLKEFDNDRELTYLGGQMWEFNDSPDNIINKRPVPTAPSEIRKFARLRNPFNNSTVMYKKAAVLAVGAYPGLNRSEDYILVAKLLRAGHRMKNLPDYLVHYRLSDDTYRRRKTWRHTCETIMARWQIHKMGVSKLRDFLLVAATQMAMFITPTFVTKAIYKNIQK
jgi:glycosyltransferase involved in cell wall biosynthesis